MAKTYKQTNDLELIGQRIGLEMRYQGISKSELSRQSGVCRVTLDKILAGKNYNILNLVEIGQALNFDLSIMFNNSNQHNGNN